jgi:hypothetical protein
MSFFTQSTDSFDGVLSSQDTRRDPARFDTG